jgi:hypothetical protein
MVRARLTICLAAVIAVALLLVVAAEAADRTPIVVHVEQGGFRWTDAGIGVLVGAGLTLAALGSMAVVRSCDVGETPSRKGTKL